MTKQEFMKLILAIRSIWSKDDFLENKEAASVWYEMLKDIPYEVANIAIQKHASTSKWVPTIAEIRGHVASIHVPESDWGSGWNQVLKAIRRYGYYNSEEALNSMDEITRMAVKRLGWKEICTSETDEQTAIRANFRMIYEELQGRAMENGKMPERLTNQIAEIRNKELEAKTAELTRLLGL